MTQLRAIIRNYCTLAMVLLAAALLMKSVIPSGHMIAPSSKTLTVQWCTEIPGNSAQQQIILPMAPSPEDSSKNQGESAGSCNFAPLPIGALNIADPSLLSIALRFLAASGFAKASLSLSPSTLRLRPPLRGPPTKS
jgi:hypothetical protein